MPAFIELCSSTPTHVRDIQRLSRLHIARMPPRAAANGRGAYSTNGARAGSSTNGAVNANGATKPPMDAVEHELLRRLLASPEWSAIRAALHARLNEVGWVDELYIRGTARTANWEWVYGVGSGARRVGVIG